MVIEGYFIDGTIPTEENMKDSMFQKGAGTPTTIINAAAKVGRIFLDTTNMVLYRDNGSSWVSIFNADAASAVGSLRTLGTNATEGAAGIHTHTISNTGGQATAQAVSGGITDGSETFLTTSTRQAADNNNCFTIAGSVRGTAFTTLGNTYTVKLFWRAIARVTDSGVSDVTNNHAVYFATDVSASTSRAAQNSVTRTSGTTNYQVYDGLGIEEHEY
tara:strand:+ start:217 stop:867 length:651 start_codon:yes stop_codon:yes gene_type:complete